jgi:hypothetical protein
MGAALNREDVEMRDSAMAAAVEALDEPKRAAVRAEARRTGLDAIIGELLQEARVSPSP